MTTTLRRKIASAALAVAATATLAGLAGTGTASAGAPNPLPPGQLMGPYGSVDQCRAAFGKPMLPKTGCFYSVSPAGWYFVGGIGA
ncbi:hypothetical protein [Rhodococcus sp. NPDC006774]|uniref:hypothetical protein n=1 Tax=Rhodococcus sp. NPDC006774 TaxID=3157186 RepID=UPI0033C6F364